LRHSLPKDRHEQDKAAVHVDPTKTAQLKSSPPADADLIPTVMPVEAEAAVANSQKPFPKTYTTQLVADLSQ
jgi:hypothetical protein